MRASAKQQEMIVMRFLFQAATLIGLLGVMQVQAAEQSRPNLIYILADDMGLGKTIEALALILYRAAQGPTLVVAPTRVKHFRR